MRIDCEKCSAAFAIDDRLIPAKGVRAQCPRCRHIKLVMPPEGKAPEAGKPKAGSAESATRGASAGETKRSGGQSSEGRGATGRGGSEPAGAQSSEVRGSAGRGEPNAAAGSRGARRDVSTDVNSPAIVPPRLKPEPTSPTAVTLKAKSTELLSQPGPPPPKLKPAEPSEGSNPKSAEPSAAGSPSAPRKPISGQNRAPSGLPPILTGPEPAPPPRSEATERIKLPDSGKTLGPVSLCASCGKELTDPFDQALGTCDECRQKANPSDEPPTVEDLPTSAPPRAGSPDESAPVSAPRPAPSAPAMNFARPDAKKQSSSRVPLIAGGSALAAVIVAAAIIFLTRPTWLGFKPPAPPPPDIPPAIAQTLPQWKLSFVGLSGDAPQYLQEGQQALSKDTPASYLDAEEAYQKALILDPQSDEAIIGYCRALALGRGATVDDATLKEALSLIAAAQQGTQGSALSLVAEAELRLTRASVPENVERARSLSERAANAKQPEVRAEAELVLGRTFTSTSLGLALQHFDTALSLSPTLARVHYERALAYESSGDIRQAMESLQERLKSDPDHPEALASLSRMFQEVGDTAAARQVYQRVLDKRPGDFHASLMLAVLLYQTEGKTADAVKALKALAKQQDRYEDRDKVELFVHLAAAERALGDSAGALDAVNQALATSNADAGAHLQALLLALDKGTATEAARHLPFVKGKLGDGALEQLLEARVRLEEQKFDAAGATYKDAAAADPRRMDAVIMAGVALARGGARDASLRAMSALPEADPTRLAPRSIVTRYYLAPGETIRDADGYVGMLSKASQDVVPKVYQALIEWHRGRRDEAEKLFREVIAEDEGDAIAHSYLSMIALSNKQLAAAKSEGERAAAAGRQKAIAHYALGSALLASGDKERGGRELAEAESLAPRFLPVQLAIASLDAASKQTERARARLVRALASDSSYLPAKRLLYSLGPVSEAQ